MLKLSSGEKQMMRTLGLLKGASLINSVFYMIAVIIHVKNTRVNNSCKCCTKNMLYTATMIFDLC